MDDQCLIKSSHEIQKNTRIKNLKSMNYFLSEHMSGDIGIQPFVQPTSSEKNTVFCVTHLIVDSIGEI